MEVMIDRLVYTRVRRCQDGLRRLRDESKPPERALGGEAWARRGGHSGPRAGVVPPPARRAEPRRQAPHPRGSGTRGEDPIRCPARSHPQRVDSRYGDCCTLEPHSVEAARGTAFGGRATGRAGCARQRPRCRHRNRHSLDAQPPDRLASARPRAWLECGAVRTVAGRCLLLTTPSSAEQRASLRRVATNVIRRHLPRARNAVRYPELHSTTAEEGFELLTERSSAHETLTSSRTYPVGEGCLLRPHRIPRRS